MQAQIRVMERGDVAGVVALQRACFPAPFPEELLWAADHLRKHIELFPEGQLVATIGTEIVASASNTLISEERFQAHESWDITVGGPFLDTFDPDGATMYGLDISVHPAHRREGLGRLLYQTRFNLVREKGLRRYATGCRLPGLAESWLTLSNYLAEVESGQREDRTLTPLLRYGLKLITGVEEYMEDEESRNCAALLEWTP